MQGLGGRSLLFPAGSSCVGPKMQRQLWVWRMVGEWIELEFPPTMVDGGLWSKFVGAWGATPVDGLSAMPLAHLFG